MKYLIICVASVLLSACGSIPTEEGLKAVVGGSLQTTIGAEPIPFSVIVISKGNIRDIGPQSTTPVPKGAETISAKGKIIRPIPPETLAAGKAASFILSDSDPSVPDEIYTNGERVK